MRKFLALCIALGAFASQSTVFADSLLDETKDIDVHGFLTQGFIKTTGDINYLANSGLGSFDYTEAGISFTKQLDDNLRTGLQLLARDIGPDGDFEERLDWFYLDYHWADWLGLRFGRVKIPFGLYNETADVDSANVPILLPQSVYPYQNTSYLLAQNGLNLYGFAPLKSYGGLEYEIYGGTIFLDIDGANPPGSAVATTALDTPYVTGGRVLWDTPVEGLRVGPTFQALRIDSTAQAGKIVVSYQFPVVMWVASAEYVHNDLSLALEYSRWVGGIANSSNPKLFPNLTVVNERAYVMGAYHVTPWLQPGVYYSRYYPNIGYQDGQQNYTHDLAATLRFDINRFWLVKLEGHYMIGTAALGSTSNSATNTLPLNELPGRWGAFMVDTTAYF